MFVIIVTAHIYPDRIQEFVEATQDNARNSILEPGIARFDFYQQEEDPSRFTLIEIYRSDEARDAHKESAHYNRWKDRVEPMLVEPRSREKYNILFPDYIEK
jgi:quinol monooxygenase YgiN